MHKLAAEIIGTFILIFAGCGIVMVDNITDGKITIVGIALVWGLTVAAMVYAVGDSSGAHLNPAVTLGFALARRFPPTQVLGYILAQCGGAFLAMIALRQLFPESNTDAGTHPKELVMQAFWMEVALTFILMFVVLGVTSGSKEKGVLAGLAVGGVITLEVLVGGPISGASMNPARSLAPAVVFGHLEALWVYLSAPFLGSALAVVAHRCTQEPAPSPV